jgi:hypothetical protein
MEEGEELEVRERRVAPGRLTGPENNGTSKFGGAHRGRRGDVQTYSTVGHRVDAL